MRTALFIFSHYLEISQVSAIRDKQNASINPLFHELFPIQTQIYYIFLNYTSFSNVFHKNVSRFAFELYVWCQQLHFSPQKIVYWEGEKSFLFCLGLFHFTLSAKNQEANLASELNSLPEILY
ncbi:MAG: hypothetical protein J6X70_01070 [Muribaculaceae bacterium]|nr:hypothetical protein [Muribaculaceae bacterium]